MSRQTRAIRRQLDQGLVLRSVRDERDIERCVAFVSRTMRETSGITTERLLHRHPTMRLDDFLFVEDEQTGEVVSTTCLIPWRCRFDEVVLDVAMLEVVATHADYRKRGLVRAQIAAFHDAVHDQGFDLSIIEGIPYYYRQFGYAYALDHAAGDTLSNRRVPDGVPDATDQPLSIKLRRAVPADIPELMRLYDATMAPLAFATLRSAEHWEYLLSAAQEPMYIVEEGQGGLVAGYICAMRALKGIRISQSGIPSAQTAFAVLRLCKQATDAEEIQIGWPQESVLVHVARSLGSVAAGDQWLLRVTDVHRLLAKLRPVFERRLLQSDYAGFTGDVTINLFRRAYRLRFSAGCVVAVEELGFVDASMGADGGDLCIPPDAFVRLVVGYRDLEQLGDAWPDIVIRPASRHLLMTLFPKFPAYLSLPYFYHGNMEPAFAQ